MFSMSSFKFNILERRKASLLFAATALLAVASATAQPVSNAATSANPPASEAPLPVVTPPAAPVQTAPAPVPAPAIAPSAAQEVAPAAEPDDAVPKVAAGTGSPAVNAAQAENEIDANAAATENEVAAELNVAGTSDAAGTPEPLANEAVAPKESPAPYLPVPDRWEDLLPFLLIGGGLVLLLLNWLLFSRRKKSRGRAKAIKAVAAYEAAPAEFDASTDEERAVSARSNPELTAPGAEPLPLAGFEDQPAPLDRWKPVPDHELVPLELGSEMAPEDGPEPTSEPQDVDAALPDEAPAHLPPAAEIVVSAEEVPVPGMDRSIAGSESSGFEEHERTPERRPVTEEEAETNSLAVEDRTEEEPGPDQREPESATTADHAPEGDLGAEEQAPSPELEPVADRQPDVFPVEAVPPASEPAVAAAEPASAAIAAPRPFSMLIRRVGRLETPAASSETGKAPMIDLDVRPVRAGVADEKARVEFELVIDNTGNGAAHDIHIATWMFPSGTLLGEEMERSTIRQPASAMLPQMDPGGNTRIRTSVVMPTTRLTEKRMLPVVVVEARYRAEDGTRQQSSGKFLVGVPANGDINHFDISESAGLREDVVARKI